MKESEPDSLNAPPLGAGPSRDAVLTAVYVACASSNEIHVLTLDRTSGTLEPVQQLAVPPGITPLAFGSQQRFLYAGLRGERPAVLAFAVDTGTGRLRILSEAPLPDPPMYVATDAAGRFLLSASYAATSFAVNAIRSDGSVEPRPVQHTSTPPRAHAIVTDRSNRYLFVTALGGDTILQYAFDAATGSVTPNAVAAVAAPPGSGPRHLVFHPASDVLYVNGELDGSVCSYAFDPANGRLRALFYDRMLPEASTAEPRAAELAIEPAGRFLYASERRSSTLCVFDLRGEPGTLVRRQSIETEEQPRSFAIDPRGEVLVVAGEKSNFVTVYAIEPASGALAARDRYPVGGKPCWVVIADVPGVRS